MVRILHICALVILGLVGAFASALLLAEHVGVTTGQGWFQLACGEGSGGGLTDCERVMASSWGRVLGMPSAYWGLVYFLALTLWFVFIGRPTRERRYWHLVPMGGTVLGVVGSILFLVVMLTQLEHLCTWCLVVHITNFLLLPLTFLLWPRRARLAEAPAGAAVPVGARPTGMKLPPSKRLVFAVAAIAMLLGVCVAQWVGAARRTAATETLRAITKVMYQMYQGGESKIALRDDDPHRGASGEMAQVTAVVFGDFWCGSCRRLAAKLEQDVVPLFDDHFRIVFKHYPLCSHCNPEVAGRKDPACCEAAQLAEAARAQGGNDTFWKAHDALFELAGQGQLSRIQHRDLARTLDLDPDRLVADMSSEAVTRRIREDAKLARSLGVRTVPAVFVCDRAVPEVAVMQMKFWEAIAHVHKTQCSQQR